MAAYLVTPKTSNVKNVQPVFTFPKACAFLALTNAILVLVNTIALNVLLAIISIKVSVYHVKIIADTVLTMKSVWIEMVDTFLDTS